MKVCRICGEHKPLSEYWVRKKNKDGHYSYCRSCASTKGSASYQKHLVKRRDARREYAKMNSTKGRERSKDWYESAHGRARTLLKGVERRSRGNSWQVGIDYDFIRSRIEVGECEVTGLPFDLKGSTGTIKNPFSPSIDRINPKLPYTVENSRVVVWQFNMMKGEMSDSDLRSFCLIITESIPE